MNANNAQITVRAKGNDFGRSGRSRFSQAASDLKCKKIIDKGRLPVRRQGDPFYYVPAYVASDEVQRETFEAYLICGEQQIMLRLPAVCRTLLFPPILRKRSNSAHSPNTQSLDPGQPAIPVKGVPFVAARRLRLFGTRGPAAVFALGADSRYPKKIIVSLACGIIRGASRRRN